MELLKRDEDGINEVTDLVKGEESVVIDEE